jgi:hypothetical protein
MDLEMSGPRSLAGDLRAGTRTTASDRRPARRKRQPRWQEPLLSDYDPGDFYYHRASGKFIYAPTNQAWVMASIRALLTAEQIGWVRQQPPPIGVGKPCLKQHRW